MKFAINPRSVKKHIISYNHIQTTNKNRKNTQKMRRNIILMKRNKIHGNHTWKSFKTTSLQLFFLSPTLLPIFLIASSPPSCFPKKISRPSLLPAHLRTHSLDFFFQKIFTPLDFSSPISLHQLPYSWFRKYHHLQPPP